MDLVLFSSQKGLCCSPGCSFISVSPRMKEKILSGVCRPVTKYFDYKDYLNNLRRGQTPYTPTVMVMYEIDAMLKLIEENGGRRGWTDLIRKKAENFRIAASDRGYFIPSYPKSNMLTPIQLPDLNATKFASLLWERGYCITPCGGELANILFRVGHAGNTSEQDGIELLDAMDQVRWMVSK